MTTTTRPPRNPARRNRNIGTSKQGRGQNNRLVIPGAWRDGLIYYERLTNPVAVEGQIGTHKLTILIEPTKQGYFHACAPDDIFTLLSHIPEHHRQGIPLIILRQPKKKEELLSPIWGRISYWANIGKYSGPAIYLAAQPEALTIKWPKSINPEQRKEFERLKKLGHQIDSDKRYYYVKPTMETIRNTQLFHTLPHEIGHYVDYLTNVIAPINKATTEAEKTLIKNKHAGKPAADKEAFAHRYAEDFFKTKQAEGLLPFPRILDIEKIKNQNLKPEWFLNADAIIEAQ